jgi:hypothetical protein
MLLMARTIGWAGEPGQRCYTHSDFSESFDRLTANWQLVRRETLPRGNGEVTKARTGHRGLVSTRVEGGSILPWKSIVE